MVLLATITPPAAEVVQALGMGSVIGSATKTLFGKHIKPADKDKEFWSAEKILEEAKQEGVVRHYYLDFLIPSLQEADP